MSVVVIVSVGGGANVRVGSGVDAGVGVGAGAGYYRCSIQLSHPTLIDRISRGPRSGIIAMLHIFIMREGLAAASERRIAHRRVRRWRRRGDSKQRKQSSQELFSHGVPRSRTVVLGPWPRVRDKRKVPNINKLLTRPLTIAIKAGCLSSSPLLLSSSSSISLALRHHTVPCISVVKIARAIV
jgi:hypothetical protein